MSLGVLAADVMGATSAAGAEALLIDGLRLALALGLPILGALALIGLLIGALAAAMGLHDPAASAAPRLILGGLAVAALTPWACARLVGLAAAAWGGAPW